MRAEKKIIKARNLVPDEAVAKLLSVWDDTVKNPGSQKRIALYRWGTIHPRVNNALKKLARLYNPNIS